ncbi:MAG: outer membrane lipoprotein-sorting protein [Candidatus Margulisiibacteriota bacterium]
MMKSLLILLVMMIPGFAITGLDVMTKVHQESQKKHTRIAMVDMKIFDNEGRERRRYFNYWTKFKPKKEASLIKFFRPKNVKGTALLTQTDLEQGAKTQWIYLPAFKSVKQLSSSDKNKSFMGSDFTYSDIAGRKLIQDRHQLIKESPKYYYIESQPVDLENAIYSKIRYVVSKTYNVVVKAIFYDLDGEKLKTLTNAKISKINGVNIVMLSEMDNHKTEGKTILTVESMEVGVKIKDDFLSIKGLKSL